MDTQPGKAHLSRWPEGRLSAEDSGHRASVSPDRQWLLLPHKLPLEFLLLITTGRISLECSTATPGWPGFRLIQADRHCVGRRRVHRCTLGTRWRVGVSASWGGSHVVWMTPGRPVVRAASAECSSPFYGSLSARCWVLRKAGDWV